MTDSYLIQLPEHSSLPMRKDQVTPTIRIYLGKSSWHLKLFPKYSSSVTNLTKKRIATPMTNYINTNKRKHVDCQPNHIEYYLLPFSKMTSILICWIGLTQDISLLDYNLLYTFGLVVPPGSQRYSSFDKRDNLYVELNSRLGEIELFWAFLEEIWQC